MLAVSQGSRWTIHLSVADPCSENSATFKGETSLASEIALGNIASYVGKTFGPTKPRIIDQPLIDAFAGITLDNQWVHVEVGRAQAEIGHTIAHGYLILSLIPSFTAELFTMIDVGRGFNYGLNRVRFTSPVPGGSSIIATQTIRSVQPKGEGLLIGSEVTISVVGADLPACIAEILILVLPGSGRL